MAGRFYEFRLHPLDLKELKGHGTASENYKKLIERGGFPEPFLNLSLDESRRWRKTHTDTILRQDLISLEVIKNLDQIEWLLEILSTRVGSLISYNSLAEDLSISDATVKRWLQLLEDLYVIFRVSSYSKNIPRSLSKSGKYYFFDLARVQTDPGSIFENFVATSIRKELDLIEDTKGLKTQYQFIRNKEKKEIDFLVQIQNHEPYLIEVKHSDSAVSKNFEVFSNVFPKSHKIQLVQELDNRFDSKQSIHVENGLSWLENLNLLKK